MADTPPLAEIIETMRRTEPDYGEEIHLETQEIMVRAIEKLFADYVKEK